MNESSLPQALRTSQGVEIPTVVVEAIRNAFKDADAILAELRWDALNGCFYFSRWGMYVGVERDGYIHT